MYYVCQRFLTIFILEEKIAIFNDFYLTSERLEQLWLYSCTRSSSLITLSRPLTSRLKIANRSFYHSAPVLWNNLPSHLRQVVLHITRSPISNSPSLYDTGLQTDLHQTGTQQTSFNHSFP